MLARDACSGKQYCASVVQNLVVGWPGALQVSSRTLPRPPVASRMNWEARSSNPQRNA